VIRPPRLDEGERLREIAIAAKAHWGYPLEQVRSWADQGDFSAAGLQAKDFFVAEEDGRAVAFASVIGQGAVCVLDDLWVEPAAMGKGVGAALFRAAQARAKTLGARTLEWEAEPNAVGFYERMGARYLRDSPPTAFGRVIPVMGVDLSR
jgi:GNAT superfamily N-acetyltransferase